MKKNLVVAGGVLLLVILGWYAYTTLGTKPVADSTHVFICEGGDRMQATFYNGKNSSVDLIINDVEQISLTQATSASGARYVNKDESFIFWNKGDSAFVSVVANGTTTSDTCVTKESLQNYKTISYDIDGRKVMLGTEGTTYFGNELRTDLNNDGKEDVVFLITHQPGGSGTFFYVVAALATKDGYIGSDGYLLGDRIAPQTTNLSQNPQQKNVVVVNFADRNPGEPMTTSPSLGKSAYLKLDVESMQWGIVVPDFEGEADPARMKLDMQTWKWIRTSYNNDTTVTPKKADVFTATFTKDGKVSFTTDCNRMGGTYTVTGKKITFGPLMSTKMYCEGSQENDFAKMLAEVSSFLFTSKGELILELKLDSGQMIFR